MEQHIFRMGDGLVHWIAEYADGSTIERDESKPENNYYAIDKNRLAVFTVILGKRYSLNCQTGQIFIDETEVNLGDAERYKNKEMKYAEGLIWFIQAHSDYQPSTGFKSGNVDESVNFGWKANNGTKKVQVVCSIDMETHEPKIKTEITDLDTKIKISDLITEIKIRNKLAGMYI